MENYKIPQRRRTPSFSSSLLDAIYRSIDESSDQRQVLSEHSKEPTLMRKQSNSVFTVSCSTRQTSTEEERKESHNLRRAIMIESQMEKHSSCRGSIHSYSTSSSSDFSSNGCGFCSSEAESNGKKRSSRRLSYYSPQRVKHSSDKIARGERSGGAANFTNKTKLRALKIHGELKKVKQRISLAGRIANFINLIFSSGSRKKVKMCSIGVTEDVTLERKSKSACSSATSFSRSCLSKTPPSKMKSNDGAKRSVRFYPVSVILGEYSDHKCIYDDQEDPGLMPLPHKIVKSSSLKRQEDDFNRETYLRSCQMKNHKKNYVVGHHCENEDDEEDNLSCSSSDLFELDHLIGIGRYKEELPVYETTNLKTNQAIANGFIL